MTVPVSRMCSEIRASEPSRSLSRLQKSAGYLPDGMARLAAAGVMAATTMWLSGCAASGQLDVAYDVPRFPPHLAHLALHPFFTEGCNRPNFGVPSGLQLTDLTVRFGSRLRNSLTVVGLSDVSYQRVARCSQLQYDLRGLLAAEDARFRGNNRCVGRTWEVNGQLHGQTRECTNVQEGYEALPR